MRAWLIRVLLVIVRWLDSTAVHLMVPKDALYQSAVQAVASVAIRPESGEWKRHQCYSLLIKAHPDRSKRDIALAIESAL